jgi:hypothetical protein
MEIQLIQLLWNGGWVAIGATMIYLFVKLEKRIEKIEEKLEMMVSRETYYRDVSGWRGEINRLEDKIDNLLFFITKEKS